MCFEFMYLRMFTNEYVCRRYEVALYIYIFIYILIQLDRQIDRYIDRAIANLFLQQ